MENPTAETKFDSLTATEVYPIMPVERCHVSDVIVRLVVFNHRNRRQSEMEVAVTAVLAGVLSQLTVRDVLGD